MNIFSKKTLTALVSVALLLLVGSGSTLAYLFTNTDSVKNTFTPAQVSCAVVENNEEYTANAVNVESKSNVTIKNTSNVPAYIRAAIIVTWKSTDGKVYAAKPVNDKDYTLNIGESWTQKGNFYYYDSVVAVGGSTSALITSAAKTANAEPPAGYNLSVEIVAEAIQAEGMGATSAQGAWAKAAAGS